MTSSNTDAFTGAAGTRAIRAEAMVEGCGHYRGERLEAALGNHGLEFRSGAFDLINFVNYTSVSLSLLSPFGEFQAAAGPRVLQLPGAPASDQTRCRSEEALAIEA
jgi:hypothetical protein